MGMVNSFALEVPENREHLRMFRLFRGSDNAAQPTYDFQSKNRLSTFLKHQEKFTRQELLELIMKNYSGAAYGDYQWPKTDGSWDENPTIYADFRDINEELSQLSLDPGFITHLPEFFDAFKNKDINGLTYLDIRNQLSESLGKKIVYRGMVLSDKEVRQIEKEGINSSFFMQKEQYKNILEVFESAVLSTYFNESVERHFHRGNYYSPIISVSAHEDIAIAVGNHFGTSGEDKKLYLFEIEVPEIDLIYYTDYFIRKPEVIRDSSKLSITVDSEKRIYPWDRNTESYIYLKINPSEIRDIRTPDVTKYKWR